MKKYGILLVSSTILANDLEEELFSSEEPALEENLKKEDSFQKSPSQENFLSSLNDTVNIGGYLSWDFSAMQTKEISLEESALEKNLTLDLFLDSRLSSEIRFFIKGRTLYEKTSEKTSGSLVEGWLQWRAFDSLFMKLGRQPLHWGNGTFWNPTHVFRFENKDSFASYDLRRGYDAFLIKFPIEKWGIQFESFLDFENSSQIKNLAGGFKGTAFIAGMAEMNLVLYKKTAGLFLWGGDFSSPLSIFDVKFEFSLKKGEIEEMYQKKGTTFVKENVKDKTFLELITQVSYDFQKDGEDDSYNMGVEYRYHEKGSQDADLEMAFLYDKSHEQGSSGQHYLGSWLTASSPFSLQKSNFVLTTLQNLNDFTGLVQASYRYEIYKNFDFNLKGVVFTGSKGEYKPFVPSSISTFQKLDVPLGVLSLSVSGKF